jgi:hypothetical protein
MPVAAAALLPLLPLLPCAHLLVPCKKRRERKICSQGLQEKGKRGSISISVKRILVGSPIAIPLGRLIINLLFQYTVGHKRATFHVNVELQPNTFPIPLNNTYVKPFPLSTLLALIVAHDQTP